MRRRAKEMKTQELGARLALGKSPANISENRNSYCLSPVFRPIRFGTIRQNPVPVPFCLHLHGTSSHTISSI